MVNASQPAQEGFIPVTGGRVWYQIVGEGDAFPLLSLHGGPGFPHDSLEPLAHLATERPVVFYDQLGCGRSDRPDDPHLWQTARFVEEVGQVREALDLEQIHLFGNSWGTTLAVSYMLTDPKGIISLTLSSPCLSVSRWVDDQNTYRKALPQDVQDVLERHEAAGTTDSAEYEEATMAFYKRHLCRINPFPDALQRTFEGAGLQVYNTMWGATEFYMNGNLAGLDLTDRLEEINVPTLFTCGRYDEATPQTTRWYHSLLPGSEFALFEDSSHSALFEEETRYLSVLSDFLGRVESSQNVSGA